MTKSDVEKRKEARKLIKKARWLDEELLDSDLDLRVNLSYMEFEERGEGEETEYEYLLLPTNVNLNTLKIGMVKRLVTRTKPSEDDKPSFLMDTEREYEFVKNVDVSKLLNCSSESRGEES